LTNFGTYIPCSLTYETTWRKPDPAPAASEAAPAPQDAEHGARAEAGPPASEAAARITQAEAGQAQAQATEAAEAAESTPRRTGTLPVYLL
jgi:hypothetical protein